MRYVLMPMPVVTSMRKQETNQILYPRIVFAMVKAGLLACVLLMAFPSGNSGQWLW